MTDQITVFEETRLNADWTFDTFATGRANDLASAAAMQVAMHPEDSYNPLFIYGDVGVGKTHLLHAIGNTIYAGNPGLNVRYVRSEDFFTDVVNAYQQDTRSEFKYYYGSLDLLLIDDIKCFNGMDRTQEEFLSVFDTLIEAKKPIVITCGTLPEDVEGLEERLVSRCEWGLTVGIEPPELELRIAILKKKAEAADARIPDAVFLYIGKHFRFNVRALEGALHRVISYAAFYRREVNLDVAKEALRDIIDGVNWRISIELIQKTVADYYMLGVSDLSSTIQTRESTFPRQIAMWLARELTKHSLPKIGESFGGRGAKAASRAHRMINRLRTKDHRLNRDIQALRALLSDSTNS